MRVYLDTSALAKWYLPEAHSTELEHWLLQVGPVSISSLTVLEMRALLARRCREGDIDAEHEMRIFAAFEEDMARAHLRCQALADAHALSAARLIASLPGVPLRSLDALHLAIAQSLGITTLATADRVMIQAAEALGIEVVRFD